MVLAFWSNYPGRSGVTTNLSSLGVIKSYWDEDSKVLLMENHRNVVELGHIFSPNHNYETGRDSLYEKNGWSDFLNRGSSPYLYSFQLISNKLFYMPMGNHNPDLVELQLLESAEHLLELFSHYFSDIWIDLSATNRVSTRKILDLADCVVVNLSQNLQQIDDFFRNYSNVKNKAFYILGNYEKDSCITEEWLRNQFRIPEEQMGVICHNRALADACGKGRLLPFLYEGYAKEKKNEHYESFLELTKTYHKMEQEISKRKWKSRIRRSQIAM